MPISIEERRLQRAGVDLSVALKCATDDVPASNDDRIERAVREANAAAITLGSKAARIGIAFGNREEELWVFDFVPNLLLIERLRARIDELLPLLGADDEAHGAIGRALGEIDRIFVPLIMAVPREMRAPRRADQAREGAIAVLYR